MTERHIRPQETEVAWRTRLIQRGCAVHAIYELDGQWVTGRIQRLRQVSRLVWQGQPWGQTAWRTLKSPRQIWVRDEVRHG